MAVKDILSRQGQSEHEALKEHALLLGLAKISRYEAECARFEKKYGKSFDEFSTELERRHESEDFSQEDDLLDWGFARTALKWWQDEMGELRRHD